MRVHIASDSPAGANNGVSVATSGLEVGLRERGHSVSVLGPSVGEPHPSAQFGQPLAARFIVLTGQRNWPAVGFVSPLRVRRWLKLQEPDIVQIQTIGPIGLATLLAAYSLRIPTILASHFQPDNILTTRFARGWRMLGAASAIDLAFAFLSQSASATVAPTYEALCRIESGANRKVHEPHVISNGVTLPRGARIAESHVQLRGTATASSPLRLIYVGRLDRDKSVDVLLRAVAIASTSVAVHLTIVGEGSQRGALERLTARLGIVSSTSFMGAVPEPVKWSLLARAHVFCMPSAVENESIATLEAMAVGLPLLVADRGGLRSLCQSGVNGERFTPGDSTQFATLMVEMHFQEAARVSMGLASRTIVEGRSSCRTVAAYVALYEHVCAAPIRSSGAVPMFRTRPGPADPLPKGRGR